LTAEIAEKSRRDRRASLFELAFLSDLGGTSPRTPRSKACFPLGEFAALLIRIVWWFPIVVDHALDPVLELEDVEVDQEPDLDIQQSE
jgi:hypothetical protein